MANSTSDSHDSKDSSSTEGSDKQGKSLEEMLANYSQQTSKKAASEASSKDDEIAELRAQVQALTSKEADRSYRSEMDNHLIPMLNGDNKADPDVVEAWLNKQANHDPRLLELWEQREGKPSEFEEAMQALKPKFDAYLEEKPHLKGGAKDDSEDRSRQAKVRSARQPSSGFRDVASMTNEDLARMSDHEFALHKAEVLRLADAGELT